ncbi:MAG TPA: NUDIX domain-containing protein [Jatrophihabitantaceae bacterium]|jgi:ADP-ribose pyrophosphatase YjhB (NUDIX family)
MPMHRACAGGIVFDQAHRLLLIQRGTPPAPGSWSLPGGRCRPGEDPAAACVREVAEETGLHVVVLRSAGRVQRAAPDGSIYDIEDFVCEAVSGDLEAGDDAADVRWVTRAELATLTVVPPLFDTLHEWDCLPD